MPIKSAAFKAHRQNIKRRTRNAAVKTAIKKLTVSLRKAYTAKDLATAKTLTATLIKSYDRAAQKKVLHRNTAARKKSRLLARLTAAQK